MRKQIRTIHLALVFAAIGLVARAQDSTTVPETLSVDQAVRYALQYNPSLRTAELELQKSEDNLAAFRTVDFLPFDGTCSAGNC